MSYLSINLEEVVRKLLTTIVLFLLTASVTKALEPVRVAIVYTAGASTEINVEVIDYSTSLPLHTISLGTLTANNSGIISFILDGGTPAWSGIAATAVNPNVIVNVKVGPSQTLYAQYRLDEMMIVQAQTGTGEAQVNGAGAFKSESGSITTINTGDHLNMGDNDVINIDSLSGNSSSKRLKVYGLISPIFTGKNIVLAKDAYNIASTGTGNVLLGDSSLHVNTTGYSNITMGYNTLRDNTTGSNNVAISPRTMMKNQSGFSNIAIGTDALSENTSGCGNIAIGISALDSNTTGCNNLAIGNQALVNHTTSAYNTAIGSLSMMNNETAKSNVAMGFNSLSSNISSEGNIAIGVDAGSAITGGFNTVLGYKAVSKNVSTGVNNTAIGYLAMEDNTSGYNNVAVGYGSQHSNTSGNNNVSIGLSSLGNNGGGSQNVAIGSDALFNSGANNNVAIGFLSSREFLGGDNVSIGANSMQNITNGAANVAVGKHSLQLGGGAGSTQYNVAIGFRAMYNGKGTEKNVGIGFYALDGIDGTDNTGIGHRALANANHSSNSALGSDAGLNLRNGNDNTFLGRAADYLSVSNFSNSVVVGAFAKANNNNQVVIGRGALGSKENQIVIGSSSHQELLLNGKVTIRNTNVSNAAGVESDTQNSIILVDSGHGGITINAANLKGDNGTVIFIANGDGTNSITISNLVNSTSATINANSSLSFIKVGGNWFKNN